MEALSDLIDVGALGVVDVADGRARIDDEHDVRVARAPDFLQDENGQRKAQHESSQRSRKMIKIIHSLAPCRHSDWHAIGTPLAAHGSTVHALLRGQEKQQRRSASTHGHGRWKWAM